MILYNPLKINFRRKDKVKSLQKLVRCWPGSCILQDRCCQKTSKITESKPLTKNENATKQTGAIMTNDKKNAMNKGQRSDSSNTQDNKKSDQSQQDSGNNQSKFETKSDRQGQADDRNKKDSKNYNNKSSRP